MAGDVCSTPTNGPSSMLLNPKAMRSKSNDIIGGYPWPAADTTSWRISFSLFASIILRVAILYVVCMKQTTPRIILSGQTQYQIIYKQYTFACPSTLHTLGVCLACVGVRRADALPIYTWKILRWQVALSQILSPKSKISSAHS